MDMLSVNRVALWASALALILAGGAPAMADPSTLGSAVGGQAGNQSGLIGCLSATAALSSGQQAGLRCDAAGNLLVDTGDAPSGGPYTFTPLGCQQLASPVLTASTGFASVPAGATLAALTVEGQPVRFRDDGTAPTGSVGDLLPVGGPWPYSGSLSAIRFIQTTAGATIDECFYK